MSEYWKSTPKYWCKHCSTYVKDTPFERRQHENTGKHQNNLKRFLREIQNDHEKTEREKQKAKDEVERLNRLTGGGSAPANTSTPAPIINKTKSGPLSAADQKRQWQQLADMGIKVPEGHRNEMAMAGDWKTVSQTRNETVAEESLSSGVRKRKLGEEEQEIADLMTEQQANRTWGRSTREYPGDGNDDLDGLLSGNIRLKKEEQQIKTETSAKSTDATNVDDVELARQSGSSVSNQPASFTDPTKEQSTGTIMQEPVGKPDESETVETKKLEQTPISLSDVPESNPIPVFKKRKVKAAR